MGVSKSGRDKRKNTGGKRKHRRKKRAYEKKRPASMTKIGSRRVRLVRVRGGKFKLRALRLNFGNVSWRSEHCTRKTRIGDVVYNAANAEYVRTKTITKNAIVTVDATPFKQWYRNYYNIDLSTGESQKLKQDKKKFSKEQLKAFKDRQKNRILPTNIQSQFKNGKLLACISSKPGQVGRADGYILEGEELDFYNRKIQQRHKH